MYHSNGITLFDYQQTAADQAVSFLHDRPVVVVPPGGGKTVIALDIIRQVFGNRNVENLAIDILVHRQEIGEQFKKLFFLSELNNEKIRIIGIDTVYARRESWDFSRIAICDECHHAASRTWETVLNSYKYVIGLTGTPRRYDGIGLKSVFNRIILGPSMRDLIRRGRLVPAEVISTDPPDFSGIEISGGDFSSNKILQRVDNSEITGNALHHYKRYADGLKTVVFCVNIKHAKNVMAEFTDAGYSCGIVTGNQSEKTRSDIIKKFRSGDITILFSVDVVSEGFDLPDIEAAILLRPTLSETLYIQQVARVLRAHNGKQFAVIIDAVGNIHRHGFPWDDRNYSLDGKKPTAKNIDDIAISIARCKICFHVFESARDICPFCGAGVEHKERVIKHKKGELKIISDYEYQFLIESAKKKREEIERIKKEKEEKLIAVKQLTRQARSLKDFQDIAKFAGYDNGWAWHRWRSRR